jgi:hypothetical protein
VSSVIESTIYAVHVLERGLIPALGVSVKFLRGWLVVDLLRFQTVNHARRVMRRVSDEPVVWRGEMVTISGSLDGAGQVERAIRQVWRAGG